MKHFLIIGGSSGIGKSLAKQLKHHGKVSATFFKNDSDLDEEISWHHHDCLNPNFDWMPDTLDGIAYCPGSIQLKPFKRFNSEHFLEDYRLNVVGAVESIQAALPALKKSGSASIVLFSTVAVQNGFNFHSLVASSKGALEGLGKALAAELAPSIRVNVIAPSLTETQLSENLLNSPQKVEHNSERHPLKRIGRAEDIANLAELLMTDKGSWISGQVLKIDGGLSTLKI